MFCHHHRWQLLVSIIGLLIVSVAGVAAQRLLLGSVVTSEQLEGTASRLSDELRSLIRGLDEARHAELRHRYPLGYVVFLTDGKLLYRPDNPESSGSVVTGLETIAVHSRGEQIEVRFSFQGGGVSLHDGRAFIQRVAGSRMILLSAPSVAVEARVLDVHDQTVLAVVGAAPRFKDVAP